MLCCFKYGEAKHEESTLPHPEWWCVMDDLHFEHMLKMSVVYLSVLKSRTLFDDVRDMSDSDIHNTLNCLEIVADTFVEMQRRLNVKPKFKIKGNPTPAPSGSAPKNKKRPRHPFGARPSYLSEVRKTYIQY
jgi:hypothetical protein